jgi:hypothetical protein
VQFQTNSSINFVMKPSPSGRMRSALCPFRLCGLRAMNANIQASVVTRQLGRLVTLSKGIEFHTEVNQHQHTAVPHTRQTLQLRQAPVLNSAVLGGCVRCLYIHMDACCLTFFPLVPDSNLIFHLDHCYQFEIGVD